jgi:hypothetical protein
MLVPGDEDWVCQAHGREGKDAGSSSSTATYGTGLFV